MKKTLTHLRGTLKKKEQLYWRYSLVFYWWGVCLGINKGFQGVIRSEKAVIFEFFFFQWARSPEEGELGDFQPKEEIRFECLWWLLLIEWLFYGRTREENDPRVPMDPPRKGRRDTAILGEKSQGGWRVRQGSEKRVPGRGSWVGNLVPLSRWERGKRVL